MRQRRRKQVIKLDNFNALEGLMQETYNNACSQINEAESIIKVLDTDTEPEVVEDYTKIAKEKTGALKVKDSAIKIKLDLAKLQKEYLGKINNQVQNNEHVPVSDDDFERIREELNRDKNSNDEKEE